MATSLLVYCGDTVDPHSGNFSFGSPSACAPSGELASGLRNLGIAMERVVGHVDTISAVRAMLGGGPAMVHARIDSLVQLVRAHNLTGISFDVEPPNSTAADATNYATFLANVRASLEPLGARVTVYLRSVHRDDVNPAVSNFSEIARNVDRMLDGDTYDDSGGGWNEWLKKYNKLLHGSNVSLSHLAPGMMSSTERGNWTCDPNTIAERMAQIVKDGVPEVAVFTFDPSTECHFSPKYNRTICPCTRAWIPAAQKFLSVEGGAGGVKKH